MKFIGHFLLLSTIIGLGVISCSEEDMQTEGVEPFVQVTFINARELSTITATITEIDTTISDIDKRIVAIDTAENKADLLDEKDSLNIKKDSLNVERSALNASRIAINNGRVNLSVLSAVGGINPLNFDTLSLSSEKTFPLNSNTPSVRFVTILRLSSELSRTDTLDITYDLDLEYRENSVFAVASKLEFPFYSFDSVKLRCRDTTTCISNEALLTIYF